VNSVLAQTWKPIEVIVVDDGSTDDTEGILARYGDQIRLIRQKNQGPSTARNAGIQTARGEIVAFLDSDDTWLPDKIERQVKLLQATESQGVVCCVCNARMEFLSGTRYSFAAASLHPGNEEGIWSNPAEILVTRFLFFNQVVAIRRRVLDKTGYFRPGFRIMEDYDLALRLSLMGPWAFIADPLVVWYEHEGDSLSRAVTSSEITERALQILEDVGNTSHDGSLLPQTLLHRQIRLLKTRAHALQLSARSRRLDRIAGRSLQLYTSALEKLYCRMPSAPRMITRAA
jgi:glycosyltransferase involved in cell wall biosynthesis